MCWDFLLFLSTCLSFWFLPAWAAHQDLLFISYSLLWLWITVRKNRMADRHKTMKGESRCQSNALGWIILLIKGGHTFVCIFDPRNGALVITWGHLYSGVTYLSKIGEVYSVYFLPLTPDPLVRKGLPKTVVLQFTGIWTQYQQLICLVRK